VEIRDPIHGPIEVGDGELAIIDSPYFQRLRNIKQLGFAELSFPGGTHNRYIHSLGAMHLAGLAFDAIFRTAAWMPAADRVRIRQLVRLAALLHDVGHPPLSHSSESLFPMVSALGVGCLPPEEGDRQASHEDYTIKLIADSGMTDVLRRAFSSLDIDPLDIAGLVAPEIVREETVYASAGRQMRGLLGSLVSSELDVDRMDYLLRDSYYTGVSYGKFDKDWLLAHLGFHENEDGSLSLALDSRALYTFDDFLLSRYHMFMMVYFHAKSVCYDHMLDRFYHEVPGRFSIPSDPDAYLQFDDPLIQGYLRESASTSRWAAWILARRPMKLVYEGRESEGFAVVDALRERLQAAGIDHLHVMSEGALSKYRGEAHPSRRIFVQHTDGFTRPRTQLLIEATQLFKRYAEATVLRRVYVAHGDLERVGPWLEELLA